MNDVRFYEKFAPDVGDLAVVQFTDADVYGANGVLLEYSNIDVYVERNLFKNKRVRKASLLFSKRVVVIVQTNSEGEIFASMKDVSEEDEELHMNKFCKMVQFRNKLAKLGGDFEALCAAKCWGVAEPWREERRHVFITATCYEKAGIEGIKCALRAGKALGADICLDVTPFYLVTADDEETIEKSLNAVKNVLESYGGEMTVQGGRDYRKWCEARQVTAREESVTPPAFDTL